LKVFKGSVVHEGQFLLLPPNVSDFVEEDVRVRTFSELVDRGAQIVMGKIVRAMRNIDEVAPS
jgi:hypothetical protein